MSQQGLDPVVVNRATRTGGNRLTTQRQRGEQRTTINDSQWFLCHRFMTIVSLVRHWNDWAMQWCCTNCGKLWGTAVIAVSCCCCVLQWLQEIHSKRLAAGKNRLRNWSVHFQAQKGLSIAATFPAAKSHGISRSRARNLTLDELTQEVVRVLEIPIAVLSWRHCIVSCTGPVSIFLIRACELQLQIPASPSSNLHRPLNRLLHPRPQPQNLDLDSNPRPPLRPGSF